MDSKMRFSFAAIFALVFLEASVSSFGTSASARNTANRYKYPRTTFIANKVTFTPRGGSSQSTELSGSIDGTTTTQEQIVTAANLDLLSERGREVILRLIENDPKGYQKHVYGNWPDAGVEDDGKKRLADQVRRYFIIQLVVLMLDWENSHSDNFSWQN
jgi:hypothetical protein